MIQASRSPNQKENTRKEAKNRNKLPADSFGTAPYSMMHCATSNALRRVRIITNPPVSLREPHCFDRPDGRYSLVEQKTLRALGRDALEGWHITAPREEVVPERVRVQEAMKREEARRLAMEMEMEGGQGKVKNVSVVAV